MVILPLIVTAIIKLINNMSNSWADNFADYLGDQEEKTQEAFHLLNNWPKGYIPNPKTDPQFFNIPVKNRLRAIELLNMTRSEIGVIRVQGSLMENQ